MVRSGITFALVVGLLVPLAAVCLADCPPDGQCAQEGHLKTVCRPVVETKTVTKRVYSDTYEEICVTRPLGYLLGNKCKYTWVIKKKYLVLRTQKHDTCVEKCVPVLEPVAPKHASKKCAPACSAPCAGGLAPPPGSVSAPAYMPIGK